MKIEGPWNRNIRPARKYNTIFAGRNTHIAYLATQGLSDEEIEANCNLIVTAPDLLELANQICLAFDQGEGDIPTDIANAARKLYVQATEGQP